MSSYIPPNTVPHSTINRIRDLARNPGEETPDDQAKLEKIFSLLDTYVTPEPPTASRDNFYDLIEAVSIDTGRAGANTFTAMAQERGVRKLPPILRDFVSTIAIQSSRNGMILAALLIHEGIDPLEVLHEHALARAKAAGRLEEMRALEHYRTVYADLVREFLDDVLAGRQVLEPEGGQSDGAPTPSSTSVEPE